jgi:hypothetical protein
VSAAAAPAAANAAADTPTVITLMLSHVTNRFTNGLLDDAAKVSRAVGAGGLNL